MATAMTGFAFTPLTTLAQSTKAKVLNVAAPWEISSLDPSNAGYVFSRLEVTETLVEVAPNGELTGGLAQSWAVSKDQLTWRFKLRAGARFHDDTLVTAAAVRRSLERAKANPGVLGNVPIKSMAAEDGSVLIVLTKGFAALPAFLAHSSTQILTPASFAEGGAVKAVIGSGPYKVVAVSPPQKVELARFAQYDGKPPAIERISYLASGRGETRGLLAENRQADLVFTHDAAAVARLKSRPGLTFYSMPIPRTI